MRSLDLDVGPLPCDPPEDDEDWSQVDELVAAVAALAQKLRHEPGLSRAAAALFIKAETSVPGIHFRSLIWPTARRVAGLPAQKRGRPTKRAPESAPK